MQKTGLLLTIGLCFVMAGSALAQTRDQNADRCKGDDPDLAIPACTALIQGNTETTEGIAIAYNNRANAYLNQDQNDRAIQDLEEAIKLKPDYATAYYNRGIAYSNKGEPQLAINDFTRTLQIQPDYIGALNNRGSAYDDLGQEDKAIADYNAVLRLDPNHGMAINNRGIAYKTLGQYQLALADFSRAIQLDPSKTNRWANRCWTRAITGDLQAALDDCNHSLKLNASYGDGHDARGVVYLKLKKADSALADFNAAINADLKDATAYYGRSLAKRMKGDAKGAQADLATARRYDSGIDKGFAVYRVKT